MSDLVTALNALSAEGIRALAPGAELARASGLLITADILSVGWKEDCLVLHYPQRLGKLETQIFLHGQQRLTGTCGCGRPQPCQHFLAGLMLYAQLVLEVADFGKLGNRSLADDMLRILAPAKAKPKAAAASEPEVVRSAQATQVVRAVKPVTRHILLEPGANRLFSYKERLRLETWDPYAFIPAEVRAFAGLWSLGKAAEDAFWEWWTTPKAYGGLPVLIHHQGSLLEVEPASSAGLEPVAEIEPMEDKVYLRRSLLLSGQPLPEPPVLMGHSLAFLPHVGKVVRMTAAQSWELWRELVEELEHSSLAGISAIQRFTGKKETFSNTFTCTIKEWNSLCISHHKDLPRLLWQSKEVELPKKATATGAIHLRPSADGQQLLVELDVRADGVPLDDARISAHTETLLTMAARDGSLLAAKSRFGSLCETIWKMWLTQDRKERLTLLKLLKDAAGFRSAAQVKAGARLVKELTQEQEDPQPILFASSAVGWRSVLGASTVGCTVAALARSILGAYWAPLQDSASEDWEEEDGSAPVDQLVVPLAHAMPRLPALVAACAEHGIALSYSQQAVQLQSLSLSVSAQRPEGQGQDWFELKPQVKMLDQVIPQEHWESILQGGHYVDETGQLRVIDLKSLDALKKMQQTLGRQRSESLTEKEERKRKALEELVRIPRLRVLDWIMLSKHGVDLNLPENEQRVLDSLLNFEKTERTPLPQLNAKLRDYQHAGYSWLAFLYQHGFGACLADDMGLGKTLQTITLLAGIKEGIVPSLIDAEDRRPSLLVVPPTLMFNWEAEIKHFYPSLYVHPYVGKGRSLIGIKEGVVLTTYELARRDIEFLREQKFDCIIFDEAQAVKNLLGERSRAMRQLQGRFKLVLTGTPLENHAGEYYSIIELAVPGLFGDYKFFMDSLKQPNGHFNPIDRARPFVLRRTKDKILKELPPKVESDVYLELSEEQKKFYTRVVGEVRQAVFEAFADKGAQQAGIVALAALTRLRQVCVSPALMDPSYTEQSPKMVHLCEKLEELGQEGHAALVFSQFTKALDHLEGYLKKAGISFLRLDGSTPTPKRKDLVEAFQKKEGPPVFLISLKAGGAGLNLTRASYVFHIDPWWNPAAENQASDRAHRMGQKSTVFIQRLLMLHTVEEKIMKLKAEKRELFDRVMEGTISTEAGGKGAVITREDFKFLLD